MMGSLLDKQQRLQKVYCRYTKLPACNSAPEAFDVFCRVLEEVEDEFSGITKQSPPPADGGGRMYCPLPDRTTYQPDGSIEAATLGHTILIQSNGSLSVVSNVSNEVEYQK